MEKLVSKKADFYNRRVQTVSKYIGLYHGREKPVSKQICFWHRRVKTAKRLIGLSLMSKCTSEKTYRFLLL